MGEGKDVTTATGHVSSGPVVGGGVIADPLETKRGENTVAAGGGASGASPSGAKLSSSTTTATARRRLLQRNASSSSDGVGPILDGEETGLYGSTSTTGGPVLNPAGGHAAVPIRSSSLASMDSASAVAAAAYDGLPKSVTAERKEELLLEARADRTRWIRRVPLPYRMPADERDPWNQDERLSNLRRCHAGKRIPSVFAILSHLYGMGGVESRSIESGEGMESGKGGSAGGMLSPSQVGDRIESVLGDSAADDKEKAVPSGNRMLEAELSAARGDTVLTAYHAFLNRLEDPACATLVQGMRNFCRNLRDQVAAEEGNGSRGNESGGEGDRGDDPARPQPAVAAKIRSYLESTYESLKSHVSWKSSGADELVRRSLESFIYGQCRDVIQSVNKEDSNEDKTEREWSEKLDCLQFVTASHLEIAELESIPPDRPDDLDELLRAPVEALQSVDRYYSPYEKLQRVLAVYHGVNASLTAALNRGRTDDGPRKLPSADDVLPTIILVVIRARPGRLPKNLRMVEDFSPPEYLRGEQGYAYTNLYGAVQFLRDFDLEDPKSSLSISPQEFRRGLERSRAEAAKRLQRAASSPPADSNSDAAVIPITTEGTSIPARAVREARLRGEKVDLDWALKWKRGELKVQQRQRYLESSQEERKMNDGAVGGFSSQRCPPPLSLNEYTDGLPAGFSRSYNFLTTRAEDVRVSDLNALLQEYRMLVSATETLIGERVTRTAANRKDRAAYIQRELYAAARQVDPSLLPSEKASKSDTCASK